MAKVNNYKTSPETQAEESRRVRHSRKNKRQEPKVEVPVGQQAVKTTEYTIETNGTPAKIVTNGEGEIKVIIEGDCYECSFNKTVNVDIEGDVNNSAVSGSGVAVQTDGAETVVNVAGDQSSINTVYGDNNNFSQILVNGKSDLNLSNEDIYALIYAEAEVQMKVPDVFVSIASQISAQLGNIEDAEKLKQPSTLKELFDDEKFSKLSTAAQEKLLKIGYPNSIVQLLHGGFDVEEEISYDEVLNTLTLANKAGIKVELDLSDKEYLKNIQAGNVDENSKAMIKLDGAKFKLVFDETSDNKARNVQVGSRAKIDELVLNKVNKGDSFNIVTTPPSQYLLDEKKNSVQDIPVVVASKGDVELHCGDRKLKLSNGSKLYYDGENSLIKK